MALQHPVMNSVVAFNNHGVDFLSAGNFVDSLQMFQGALKVVSQTISAVRTTSDSTIEQARTKLEKRPVSAPSSSISPKETNHFLYTRGFHVTQEQMDDQPLLASIFMFNMALAHHLRSFENPSIRRRSCERALKLYSLAFEAFLQEINEKCDMVANRANIVWANK